MVQNRTIGRRVLKWMAIFLGSLVILLVLAMVFLQTPYGQGMVKHQAEKYLRNKLQTSLSVGSLKVDFLSGIHLSNLYLEDQQQKVLLSIDQLDVLYDFKELFRKYVILSDIQAKGVNINFGRDSTSEKFNYDFITDAFAFGDTTKKEDASGFSIHLRKISLDSIRFSMNDRFGGQQYEISLPRFRTDLTSSDLDKLHFKANYVLSDGLNCSILLKETGKTEERVVDTLDATTPFRFLADTVKISNTVFRFENRSDQTDIKTKAGSLFATMVDYRSDKLTASAGLLTLMDHSTEINIKSVQSTAEEKKVVEVVTTGAFSFYVDSVAIERNHIGYNDNAYPKKMGQAIDYSHIGINDLNLHLSGLGYQGRIYTGRVHDLNLSESSGFSVLQLSGGFKYSDSVIRLQQMLLRTPKNLLKIDADVLAIPGRKGMEKNYRIIAAMSSPALRLEEALYFQPELSGNKYFAPLLKKSIQVSTRIIGTLDNLHIPQIIIKEAGNRISASVDVLHLPDTKNMVINLRLKEFSSTRSGMLSYLPKGTIPDSLLHYIPETFSLKGIYRGSLENMYADLQLVSSDGNATVKGSLRNFSSQQDAVYDLALKTDNIDLGKLLQDTSVGKIKATIKVKGKGFDIKTAKADYNLHMEEAGYHGYSYRLIDVRGSIDNNIYEADLHSADPNLGINGNFFLNLNPGHMSFKTNTRISIADLHALGLTSDSLDIRADIAADFPMLDTNGVQGNVLVSDAYINYKSKPVSIDTMQLEARHNIDTQLIRFASPIADISLVGQYTLLDLIPAIKTITDNYLSTTATDTVFTTNVKAALEANVHIPDSIISVFTGIRSVAPFYIMGNINTEDNELKLFSAIPKIKIDEVVEIDTIDIAFVTQDDNGKYDDLRFALSIGTLTGSDFELRHTYLQGGVSRGVFDAVLRLDGENAMPRYMLPFIYVNDPLRPNISIGDSLMINRKSWSVSDDNIIYLDPKNLAGSMLTLRDKNTLLELNASDNNESGLPLALGIKEFNIKDIAELLITDTSIASGMVNGQVSISSFEPFNFTTHITIDSLNILKAKMGNFRADVEQKDSGVLAVSSSLKGAMNDITLDGQYNTIQKNADLNLDIKQFELSNAGPLLSKYVGELNGILKGNLSIKGTMEEPVIRGKITADSLQAIYAMTGTYLKIPNAAWTFDEEGIQFDDLQITDSSGHEGKISGTILTKNYRDFIYDLAVNLDNFEVVGRKKFPQQDIYGPANADVKLTMKGNQEMMNVEGSVKVMDKSYFTYVYRQDTYDQLGEGLVEFFDPLHPADTTKDKIGKSTLGFQLLTNLYVHLTPGTSVEIMLDEISGDHLNLKGTADLNLIMKPGGEMSITGAYLLDGGEYELSLAGLIRKKFKIEKGSTINWYGDPLKGIMNITALYETKTSAGELVNDIDNIPGINKQKFDFDVYIILTNELLKPDIDFRLDMSEQDQDAFDGVIYTRIKQINAIPAELNKQVMGLLAFNKFIAENPFNSSSTAGSDFETQAFNTAGEMLTQELTDLVGKYVKDLNIEFGLEQQKDYTSGKEIQKTDFTVGISKSLADNRLNVYVGNSFALEGANQDENALEGLAGDVTLEYLLTSDGRFRLKGYRLTDNDLTFQGNIVRTGVSFVVVLEFNRFKNAFKKSKRDRS